jgi:hypothetical protein
VIVVDSSVWVDYLRGRSTAQTDWVDRQLGVRPLAITDIILCEVLQGIRDDQQFVKARRELLTLELFSTGGRDVALAAATNYRMLRARGRTIRGTIDCLIATFCLLNDHALLHDDRDYDVFEHALNLAVVHP